MTHSLQHTVIAKPRQPADAATGMAAGTIVMTMKGALPVEQLAAGDRIVTRDGALRLVRLARRLHHSTLVRVNASTLGHDRPPAAVLLCPDQAVLLRDWRAQVIYGADEVLVAASRLVDGTMITVENRARPTWVFDLMFDTRAIVLASGIEVASAPLSMPVQLAS